MIRRGIRRFHLGRKSTKLSVKDTGVSSELVQAAQALRLQLNDNTGSSGKNSLFPLENLMNVAQAIGESPKVPESVYKLVSRTLLAEPNYKGEMSATSLQLVFRAVARNNADLNLVTKLYMDLYRHSKLSAEEKLENGREYYRLLRSRGFIAEADKMVAVLLRDNQAGITEQLISELCEITFLEHPKNKDQSSGIAHGFMAIISSCNGTPYPGVLNQCIKYLLDCQSLEGLEMLSRYVYFTNPHFEIPDEVAIVFLDAYLQLPNKGNRSGQKILNLSVAGANSSMPLEVCELLLMACVHFQEPVSLGSPVFDIISNDYDPNTDYTKETWDVLAQWAVYSGNSPLVSLKSQVLDRMPSEYCDSRTLCAVLLAATDKAQCSEQQISEVVDYFRNELELSPDAAANEILIRRALKAVEIDHARQLFIESNTDWNVDSNKHTTVLSELLVAMCRTTSIPRQVVMDTYQRVRLFVPLVSYDAQIALLEMFLQSSLNNDLTPAGVFLIEQFGEKPDLPFEKNREIFDLFFARILTARDETQAWDLFGMLNCTISLPYEAYYPLQQKLCSLGRPDAAHLLFRQLRSRSKKDSTRPPGEEMYLMLFAEYAKWRYEEGIMELETYFRVDLNSEMTPTMMNRMLGAYVALGDGHKVSNLWTEAMSLPRGGPLGPNEETMCLMLKFYSNHMGMDAVEDLWAKMPTTYKVAPAQQSLKQYVIANCYHGYYTRALELVKMAPEQYHIKISDEILQALYNWTMLPGRKQEIKEFALEHYPQEWASLSSKEGSLKEILLPKEDEVGETDDKSLRLAAVRQLLQEENVGMVVR